MLDVGAFPAADADEGLSAVTRVLAALEHYLYFNTPFAGISRLFSFSGRSDPSVQYYQRILWHWTVAFGGSLRISRDPQNASKIRGPLVKYFFAVVRPVMDRDTPSLQSLPDIVRRQKRFEHWYSLYKQHDQSTPEGRAEYLRALDVHHPRIAREQRRCNAIFAEKPSSEELENAALSIERGLRANDFLMALAHWIDENWIIEDLAAVLPFEGQSQTDAHLPMGKSPL
jgi:hypothetical protein